MWAKADSGYDGGAGWDEDSLFKRLALIAVPVAATLEVGFLSLGHDSTYFRVVSPSFATSIRQIALSLALAAAVFALLARFTRR